MSGSHRLGCRMVTDLSELADLAGDWERCRRRTRSPRLQDRFEEVHRSASEGGARLRALVATDGGAVVGLLPLLVDEWQRPWKVRTTGSTRAVLTTALSRTTVPTEEVLGAPTGALAAMLVDAARRTCPSDVLALPRVRVGSSLDEAVGRSARVSGRRVMVPDGAPKPRLLIRLEPGTDPLRLYRGAAKHRRAVQRDQRRAADFGLLVETANRPEQVDAFLDRAAEVWRQSWHGERSGPLLRGGIRQRLQQRAARGWLRAYLMVADGAPVAFLWGSSADATLTVDKMAFAPRWGTMSPGKLLLLRVLTEAGDDGVNTVDLGYGDYPYKRRWANDRILTKGTLFVRIGPRPLAACVPPASYQAARSVAVKALEGSSLGDRARRFSSRQLGR